MKAYFPEGVFELPDGWKDATVNVYQLASSSGRVSVVRAREDATVPFDEYCRHVRVMVERNLPSYRALGEQLMDKDGIRACRMEFTWRKDGEDLHQVQLLMDHGGSFVVFTFIAPLPERGVLLQFEKQLLATIRFRAPQSP